MTDRVISNPIINSPYRAPARHFAFDNDGITDRVVEGRRPSSYFVPVPRPRKRGTQQQLEFAELTADQIEKNQFVNEIRARVTRWRDLGRPDVTPTTRRLLEYWTDPERDNPVLFCQLEAAETAIYLAEAAQKAGDAWIRNGLDARNEEHNAKLNRVALKMATGSGKTVVMAMLIAWQTLNKVASPQDARFAKRFLVVAPGLTIKDRLRVLRPEHDENYYKLRDLVPADLSGDLSQARIVITNFHALQRRETKQGQGISKTTKDLLAGYANAQSPFLESWSQMVSRVCRDLGGTSEIVVFNDEAHHCYKGRFDHPEADVAGAVLTSEEKAEAKANSKAARVWFTGLRAIAEKLGVKTIYDLSATPSFLSGSGYQEGTLFPWVVSDFALVEAIESGIVKIPRVPVDDNNAGSPDVTFLNLWPSIGPELPKKSRKEGTVSPDNLPPVLDGALHSLYSSYEKAFAQWDGSQAATEGEPPPVFIVVCNNTTVSKMVYDYIAGWNKPIGSSGKTVPVLGELPLFSNVRDGAWLHRPRTILVDSGQLESGEALSPEFKRIAAAEIEEFTTDYLHRFPGRSADDIDDAQILREVMNTVGKKGKLGEPVRCVVSVSMLTEGWDANTVSHILGVRAFGTQLLCEQVVGRGLRRRSYAADENGFFTPEYADVYGVPFQFIPTVAKTRDVTMKPNRRVHADPDRAAAQITFPKLIGYRIELPDEELWAQFTSESRMVLGAKVPTETVVSGLIGMPGIHTLEDLRKIREQEIAFRLAGRVMDLLTQGQDPKPWYFPQVLRITKAWLTECLICEAEGFPGLLLMATHGEEAAKRIFYESISSQKGDRTEILRPVLRPQGETGSTADVDFFTTKEVYLTSERRCHVNFVVLDGPHGNTWEEAVARHLEVMPQVAAYVKNDHLGFAIPYAFEGRNRQYLPDFLVRLKPADDERETRTLIVEVSGGHKPPSQTKEKAETTRNLWVQAVNNHGGFGLWNYCELRDPARFRHDLEFAITALQAINPPAQVVNL
ncbi:MAG TPA: DEAD/DEAH box helicase family protein [Streptosporangiaceae bacterium]|nr:DEAD/DEAH box helicase family protein [Streptosporangiaceae bacterium]